MKPEKVRRLLLKFMNDISPLSVRGLEEEYCDILDELSNKLSKVFSVAKEVEEYLDFILREIDQINEFFKIKNRGRVPYSHLFNWANKDKRISKFLFEKGVEKKFLREGSSSEMDVAGFEYKGSAVKEDEVVLIHDNEVYGCVFVTKRRSFFFSPAINKLIVQNSKGKVFSYKDYFSSLESKRIKPIKLLDIFNSIIKRKENNESSVAFKNIYLKQLDKKRKKK